MKAKILLIEDSHSQAKEMIKTLKEMNYDVIWADGGIKGLRMAREENPDLILLDVIMPDMDGHTVCRWLKLNDATREIPIIMLTVKGGIEDKVEGLEVGANDYLPKPVNNRELEARIYAALRTRSLQNDLRERNKELQELLEKVEVMAVTDPLTGLYNRRRFYEALKKEFAAAKRYHHPLTCLMLDIDYFKRINDEYGHAMGDEVLKEIGKILSSSLREVDIPARYGGEEFVILFPHTPKDKAIVVAERIMDKIRKTRFKHGGKEVSLTVSIGIASTENIEDGSDDDLVRYADSALYIAKEKGRNRLEVFSLIEEGN